MADGKVIIETGLDNSGLEKDLSSSKKAVEASAKQTEKAIGESAKRTAKEVEQSTKQSSGNSSRSTRQAQEEQRKEYRKTEEQSKQSAKQTEKHWTGAAGRIKSLISTAAKTSVVAVAAGTAASIKSGISFESAFTGVKKTVDATSGELAQLKTDIRGMAKEMPESVEEIAGVAEAAGQLGIKTKSITGFTKTMVMLGDATNLSSEAAATALARFANVTGMSQKNFDKLGSSVVALGNNMATTEKEIVEMATRISGAGSQVGLSEAQIMSYSAALSSVGIEAEAGGTAFSTLLSKMNLATVQGGKSLDNFAKVAGMSSGQFKKAFKEDAAGAVLSFIKGLDGINKNGGSAIKTLNDMGLKDVRIRDALLRAAGASDTFTEALDIGTKAWGENTALTKEAKTRYETMESQLQMTGNKLKDMGISIYSSLEKPMVKGVAAANKALGSLSKKLEKGGIRAIVPEEAVNTVENLGKIAGIVAKGGIKALGAGAKVLRDNMGVVIPLTSSLFGIMAGHKVFTAASVGVKALAGAYKVLITMEKANAITLVASQGGLTALQTVVGVLTGKVNIVTAAVGGFNKVLTLMGGPIGLAVVAAGALAAGVAAYALTQKRTVTESEKFASSCEKLSKKQDDVAKSVRNLKKENAENVESTKAQGVQADRLNNQLAELMKVENKSAGTKARIKNIVAQLNKIFPELNLKYDEEKDKLNQSTSAIKKNIEALKEQAMAKAYQKGMEKSAEKVSKAEIANEEAVKKRAEAYERLEKAQEKFNQLKNEKGLGSGSKELAEAAQKVRDYEEALKDADSAISKSEKNLNAANQELQTYSDKFTAQKNYTTYLKELDALAKEAGIKASKIPESVGNGIKQGVYANPTSGKELKQLIKLDEIVNSEELAKMQQQGMKIPQYLTQGIADGSVSFKTAAQKLKNGIDWTGMIEKAKEKGKEVPNSVAEGIRSGQYAVPTSVTEVENLANFDRLKAKAQQGGIQIPEYLANGITSGSMKPAQAAKALGNLMSFQDAIDKAGLQGAKISGFFVTGLSSGSGKAKTAGGKVAKAGASGANKEKSGFTTVGKNLSSGIASGITSNSGVVSEAARQVIQNAKKAANQEADSHSPSRVFRDEVGKFLPLGVAVGIRRHTGEVEDASREMSQASVKATAQALDIHSPSRVFRDAIGKNIPAGIAKGVREAQSELNAEMKSVVNTALNAARTASSKGSYAEIGNNLISGLSEALNTAKSRSSETVQEIIDSQYNKVATQHEKKEQALQNKISKLGSKKENKRKKAKLKKDLQKLKARNKKEEEQLKIAGEKAAAAYNTAFEKEADRLTQIAQEKIQALSEEYQEQYSEIKSKMDSLTDKQQSWGNIYDLDQNIYDLEKYQKNLKSLENKIPESMMEKILGMDVDAATAYMEWFRAMSAEEQKAYINKWNTQQNMSKSFSSSFFADDFAKIQREYQSKLKSATVSLEKEMKKAGQNIAKGLTAGMQSETRNMSKAMKKICDNLIKTAKKKLKINSPSKEFEEIGKYNIQGAEKGHGKEAPKLYRQMESVSGTMAERFAKARFNAQEIQARMQTAVDRQMEAITTRVQPVLSKQTTTPVPEILYVGPEKIEVVSKLDGRELARETVQYIDKGLSTIAARKTRGGV